MHGSCVLCVDDVAALGFFDAWTEQSNLILRPPISLKTLIENVAAMEVSVD